MSISIYCDNKGCFKQNEALLDVEKNEVLCGECGKPITNVTSFIKVELKHQGQIKRFNKKQQAFSVRCPFCNKEACPKLTDKKELVCSVCDKNLEQKLNKPYLSTVKEFLNTHRPPS